jgi:hypothetical protein
MGSNKWVRTNGFEHMGSNKWVKLQSNEYTLYLMFCATGY